MTEINIREHTHYVRLYDEIMDFIDISSDGDYPSNIDGFLQYASDRFYHNLKPFWEFSLDEVRDAEDPRYPSDKWLAALYDVGRRTCYKRAFLHGRTLLEQIRVAWLWSEDADTFSFDEKSKMLTAYTGGWSGCEDIIYTLTHTFPSVWFVIDSAEMKFDMRSFLFEEVSE